MQDREIGDFTAGAKDLTDEDLKAQLKTLKQEKINKQIADLQKELGEL